MLEAEDGRDAYSDPLEERRREKKRPRKKREEGRRDGAKEGEGGGEVVRREGWKMDGTQSARIVEGRAEPAEEVARQLTQRRFTVACRTARRGTARAQGRREGEATAKNTEERNEWSCGECDVVRGAHKWWEGVLKGGLGEVWVCY
jgi:hypothetical protein